MREFLLRLEQIEPSLEPLFSCSGLVCGHGACLPSFLSRCVLVFDCHALYLARCIVARADIALASRDLGWPANMLDAARSTLEAHGDHLNAGFARYLEIRRLLLIGRLDDAERLLADLDPSLFPPASRTFHEL